MIARLREQPGDLRGHEMHEVLVSIRGDEIRRRTLSHIPSPGDYVCIRVAGEWVRLRVLAVIHTEQIEGNGVPPTLACVRIAETDTDG